MKSISSTNSQLRIAFSPEWLTGYRFVVTKNGNYLGEVNNAVPINGTNATVSGQYIYTINTPILSTDIFQVEARYEGSHLITTHQGQSTGPVPVAPPEVNAITSNDTIVTGKAKAGSEVVIYANNVQIAHGTAVANGNFSIVIPTQSAGTTIKVTATNSEGITSPATTLTVKAAAISVIKPTVAPISDVDTLVTGKTSPNASVKVMNGNNTLAEGITNANGDFSIVIPKQKAGTVLSILALIDTTTSDATVVTVSDKTPPNAPSVNSVKEKDTIITGKTEANATIQISINGNKIAEGKADASGQFSVNISSQKEGTILSVTATDAAGNTSVVKMVTVESAPLEAPTLKPVGDSDTFIEGTATPGASIEISIPHTSGGTSIFEGSADATGNFKIVIPKQQAGTVITVIASKDGLSSTKVTVKVSDNTPPVKATIDPLTEDSTVVSGTAEPNATIIVYDTFGNIIAAGGSDASGRYQVIIVKQVVNSVIQISVMDSAGNMSERASRIVSSAKISAPTVNPVSDKDTVVSGKATSNATITLQIPQKDGGSLDYEGKADADGNFQITVAPIQAGSVIQVTAALNGKTSDKVSVTVTETVKTDYNLTVPSEYELGNTTISGTFGKDIFKVRLWVNGKVVAQATTDTNGNYTFANVSQYVSKKTDLIEIVGVDKNYGEQIRKAISVTGEEAADYSLSTPNSYTLGNKTISGTFGKDISKVRLWVNGKVVLQAATDANGNYTLNNVQQFITNASDLVEIVGVDSRYVEQTRKAITVSGNATFDYSLTTPSSYTIGANSVSGTFGKDIAKVRLWVNGKVVLQATTDSNGNYTLTNIKQFISSPSDVVEIVGVDSRYVEQARKAVPVKGEEVIDFSLTVNQNPYTIGSSTILTGTFGKSLSKVRLFVNGSVVAQATTDANGNYTFTNAARFITSKTDVVQVVAVDAQYIQRASRSVFVQ
ncbi:Ig-like domain-containing protein [Listeria floridensis]|uniref:Ig-like domain-containing protein n=1 Tax=Listeria floridensis TaxID=1494962 RepID=UPI0011EA0B54|nr:Ig-like domain-containing protein [Listeria floridensis]